jgi:hypothetical protein
MKKTSPTCCISRLFARLLILVALLATGAHAQWLNYPTPGTPRTPGGKPDLTAPAPRALDGKPDLSGAWHVHATPIAEMKRIFGDNAGVTNVPGMEIDTLSKYALNIFVDWKAQEVPMRATAAEIFRKRATGQEQRGTCLPLGIPASGIVSEATKIVQSPRVTIILYESDGTHRQIYTDGHDLPKEFEQPAWLGYSAGKWVGDTLVVESSGFNDKTWLDLNGHPHGEALRVVERFHRRDFGHVDVETTFNDPEMYTKPFSIKYTFDLLPDSDVFENICENEKDSVHMAKGSAK